MVENYTEDWIEIEEAPTYLRVLKDTVSNWIKKPDLPTHKIGKLWELKRSELDVWVKSGKVLFNRFA